MAVSIIYVIPQKYISNGTSCGYCYTKKNVFFPTGVKGLIWLNLHGLVTNNGVPLFLQHIITV